MRPSTIWTITFDQGRWYVERNGVTVWDGDLDECEDYVRGKRTPNDRVTRIEQDGYRWDLTQQLR